MKWCIKAGPGYNVIGKWKAYKTVLPKPVTCKGGAGNKA